MLSLLILKSVNQILNFFIFFGGLLCFFLKFLSKESYLLVSLVKFALKTSDFCIMGIMGFLLKKFVCSFSYFDVSVLEKLKYRFQVADISIVNHIPDSVSMIKPGHIKNFKNFFAKDVTLIGKHLSQFLEGLFIFDVLPRELEVDYFHIVEISEYYLYRRNSISINTSHHHKKPAKGEFKLGRKTK